MTAQELDKLIYDFIVKHGIPNFKGLVSRHSLHHSLNDTVIRIPLSPVSSSARVTS